MSEKRTKIRLRLCLHHIIKQLCIEIIYFLTSSQRIMNFFFCFCKVSIFIINNSNIYWFGKLVKLLKITLKKDVCFAFSYDQQTFRWNAQ